VGQAVLASPSAKSEKKKMSHDHHTIMTRPGKAESPALSRLASFEPFVPHVRVPWSVLPACKIIVARKTDGFCQAEESGRKDEKVGVVGFAVRWRSVYPVPTQQVHRNLIYYLLGFLCTQKLLSKTFSAIAGV
jgi:hypothetical protein